jgi:hypothetical protein
MLAEKADGSINDLLAQAGFFAFTQSGPLCRRCSVTVWQIVVLLMMRAGLGSGCGGEIAVSVDLRHWQMTW